MRGNFFIFRRIASKKLLDKKGKMGYNRGKIKEGRYGMYYLFEDILSGENYCVQAKTLQRAYDDLYDATELDWDRVDFLDIIEEEEVDAMGLDVY